ncbi:MAG TPA: WG repeat-containing protein, partial [Cytophagaceae bacterium]|nr:WG repeat-containing protein [Cytophagaceae bacterium]
MFDKKKKLRFTIYIFLLSCHVTFCQHDFSISKKENLFGVANSHGKFIILPKYKEIQELSTDCYAVKNEKGLWGFYSGETKISECQFDNFHFFSIHLIIVQKSGRWGAIDGTGKTIIDFRYRYLNYLSTHKCKAGLYNQWCIRNFNNQIMATFEYDSLEYLGDNVYRFCLAGKYGLIDQNGKLITTEFQNIFESTLQNKYPKKEFEKIPYPLQKGNFKIPLEERFDTVYHF